MKLQSKLIGAFGVLTLITLAVALLGLWQAQRLGSALYEVGVVRLPSLRGLGQMSDAMATLDNSAKSLLNDNDPALLPGERERQRIAWSQFEAGWNLYEPLPQTPEEAEKWRRFVPLAKAWQEEYSGVLAGLVSAVATRDAGQLAVAHRRLDAVNGAVSARTAALLADIAALNYRVADEAKRQSVASYGDMARVRTLMIFSVCLSVAAALALGLIVGRRFSRPIVEMANALTRVADGDRQVRVETRSHDEGSQMAQALNRMVGTLRTNEAQLRLLSDNLPDTMLYQVRRERDGRMRFLHVSAGVERLHGVTVEDALRDSSLLYRQFVEEDRAAVAAAEQESLAKMEVFSVVSRTRTPDGSIHWRSFRSKPRRDADGCVIWEGIETDITAQKKSELERERLARVIDAHFDAACWIDARSVMTYMNDAACRAVGYAREELVGRSVALIAPKGTPEQLQRVWQRLRTDGHFTGEAVCRRKDGTEFPVEVVSIYFHADGEELCCGFARDISERKAAAHTLEQRLAELQRWQKVTLGRETRVQELKAEINELCGQLGAAPRYPSQRPEQKAVVAVAGEASTRA